MGAVNYLWNPINDNIVREFDDAGNTIAEYTTEPDLYGNVVSQYRNGQTSYLLSDGHGNTTELTNDAGSVTDTIRYSAFGEVTQRTGTTEIPFQYVGQKGYYRDNDTGNYSIRQRPLSSRNGRWLTVDPVGGVDGPNVYRYVANNPVLLIDPSGLIPLTLVFGAFIPKRLGAQVVGNPVPPVRWGIEPGPKLPIFSVYWMFGTDDRNKAGQPGTYRLRSTVKLDTDDIGRLECSVVTGGTSVGESHRIRAHGGWLVPELPTWRWVWTYVRGTLQSKTAVLDIEEFWRADPDCCRSVVKVRASAGYPFAWLAPNIDYHAYWQLQRVDCGDWVTVELDGRHDQFPAYEGLINAHLAYEYYPDPQFTGPELGNLSTSMQFRGHGISIYAPLASEWVPCQ